MTMCVVMSSAGHKQPQATQRARLLSAPSTLATVVILLVMCSMSCVASGEVTAEGDEQMEGVHVVTGDELDEAEWDTSKTLVMNEASDPARTSTDAMPYHTTAHTPSTHCLTALCTVFMWLGTCLCFHFLAFQAAVLGQLANACRRRAKTRVHQRCNHHPLRVWACTVSSATAASPTLTCIVSSIQHLCCVASAGREHA
jgi:hypothetical protein